MPLAGLGRLGSQSAFQGRLLSRMLRSQLAASECGFRALLAQQRACRIGAWFWGGLQSVGAGDGQ